jgi:tripartite-type tricarboxylate transporter receptor subunit TctC
VLFNNAIGVDITHVPYRGTGPAMQDVIAGRIDYICDVISTTAPLVSAGSVNALAILSPQRSPVMPELATAHEQGLKEFDADGWNALFFPKGTPDAIVRRLLEATNKAVDTPRVRERMDALGVVIEPPERRTREYYLKTLPAAVARQAEVMKGGGLSAD